MNVIEIKNLTKKFVSVTALDGLSLSVKKGEIHGFLGPNGSGKSTAIRVLLGLIQKTDGEVALMGKDPWSASVELHKGLAYVPGDVNLWPNLTGGEIIDVLASLRGGVDESKREKLVKRFDLNPAKKFKTYSKGNKQKVALIAALSSEVDLLILDEPTSGLDPLMEQFFQQEIKLLKEEGKTILLSSHILSEVEALCDRATIIKEGKTVSVLTLAELREEHDNLESLFLSQYGEA